MQKQTGKTEANKQTNKQKTIPASNSSTELIPAVDICNSQSNKGFHIFWNYFTTFTDF